MSLLKKGQSGFKLQAICLLHTKVSQVKIHKRDLT